MTKNDLHVQVWTNWLANGPLLSEKFLNKSSKLQNSSMLFDSSEAMAQIQSILILFLVMLTLYHHHQIVLSCNQLERDSLLSFYHNISNWSPSTDCCQWQGIACNGAARVTRLWLPGRRLSGPINPSLANLPFLAHINLSHNHFSGPLAFRLRSCSHLQTLDLSFNSLSGPFQPLPVSIQTLDISSNLFNGSINPSFLSQAFNLISFNVSNNSFTDSIPSSICKSSPRLKTVDFSMNRFAGPITPGLVECRNLQVLRAGSNSLSGWLPDDLYSIRTLKEISMPRNQFSGGIKGSIVMLSNLTILELNENQLAGELPPHIGLLSKMERFLVHTNSFNGALPPSLMDCINLTTLLLRNNRFAGEISTLNFSTLHRLHVIDLGNNSFYGNIPDSLCSCSSMTALRLAYNQLVGEIPPCIASLTSLTHLSLSDNNLSNVVGALKVLRHCDNLAILLLARCFNDVMMLDDNGLMHLSGFHNLQLLSLGGSKLKGQIPSWIAKLRKLKILNLSYNNISGPIPTWLGSMQDLFLLNLTQNFLSGDLPHEIGQMPALVADEINWDWGYLSLPFLFNSLEYNSMFNLRRGLKLGSNNLSGRIPQEIGRLKLLQVLDLSNNNFRGSIPDQLSRLTNLEMMNISVNHLSGEIPKSLTQLHFMSFFSVANNDLEGEIPSGGQFDTFSVDSFEGNPKLCDYILNRSCTVVDNMAPDEDGDEEEKYTISWYYLPFGLGYAVGLVAVSMAMLLKSCYS